MCVVFCKWQPDSEEPLILAGNRDEFYPRATTDAHWWLPQQIFAGRDDIAGGTWLAADHQGKFAVLTNIRDPQSNDPNRQSRGELVVKWIEQRQHPAFIDWLVQTRQLFNGFNLLFGDRQKLFYFNSNHRQVVELPQGHYALSNADLTTEWPKTKIGKERFTSLVIELASDDAYFQLLNDKTEAPHDQLPNTGIPSEWEQRLSAIFIHFDGYGTRNSTVLRMADNGDFSWHERYFDDQGRCHKTVKIPSLRESLCHNAEQSQEQ